MENTFCKVEDISHNKYILTDKNKQLLQCIKNDEFSNDGFCYLLNLKKVIDNPKLLDNIYDNALEDTKIQCKIIKDANGQPINTEVINKSNINFDNYNIASINKDMIKNKDGTLVTNDQLIDSIFTPLIMLDGLNIDDKKKLDVCQKLYNNTQNLLIKEDITKVVQNTKPSNDNTKSNNDNTIIFSSVLGIVIFILLCLFIFKYRETIHKYFSK
jgi:hypothetical protein